MKRKITRAAILVMLVAVVASSAILGASAAIEKVTDQWCFDIQATSYYTSTPPIIDGKKDAGVYPTDPTISFYPGVVLDKGISIYDELNSIGTSQNLTVTWDGDYIYCIDERKDADPDLRALTDCWKTDGGIIALQVSDPSSVEPKMGNVLQFYYTLDDTKQNPNGALKVRQIWPGLPKNSYLAEADYKDFIDFAVEKTASSWNFEIRISWDFIMEFCDEYTIKSGKQIEFNYCFWDFNLVDGAAKQVGYARWVHQYSELGLTGQDYGGWGVLNLIDADSKFPGIIYPDPATVTTAPATTVAITTAKPVSTTSPTKADTTATPADTTVSLAVTTNEPEQENKNCGGSAFIGFLCSFTTILGGAAFIVISRKRVA